MPSKKLIFLLFIISSTFYIFKLLRITVTTWSPSILKPRKIPFSSQYYTFHEEESFTLKELNLLSSIITRNQSKNILFFGLNPQFLPLAKANERGSTIFLEDDIEKIRRFWREPHRDVEVHVVRYNEVAGKAYELLRHGREQADCGRRDGIYGGSRCRLAMRGLPREVLKKSWDVVVVDGPRGGRPDAPGRMAAIYTAAVIARMGRGTDVVVHDVDRMIEKWYSWEFLCHDNLVAAKGKLWHFRIDGRFKKFDAFCPDNRVQVV